MTVTYLWAATSNPAIGAMTSTALFSDGVAGDTTTGETASQSLTFGTPCAYNSTAAVMTAVVAFSCPVIASSFALTCSRGYTFVGTGGGGIIAFCAIPDGSPSAAGGVYTATLKYSSNGSSWTSISIGAVATSGTTTLSFTPVTCNYLQLILTASYESYSKSVTQASTIYLSDLRPTYGPTAPASAPTVTGPGSCSGGATLIQWTAVACADGYVVEINGGTPIDVGNVLSYLHSPVTVGTAYAYRVRAYRTPLDGPWSSVFNYTPCNPSMAPTTSTTVVPAAVCEGRQISVTFAAVVAMATGYRIYLFGPGIASAGQLVYNGVYLTTPFVITPVQYATYTIKVIAYNGIGDGPTGAAVTVTPCELGCDCPAWTETNCRE